MTILYCKRDDKDHTIRDLATKNDLHILESSSNYYRDYKAIKPDYVMIDEDIKKYKKIEKKHKKNPIFFVKKFYKNYVDINDILKFFKNIKSENFFIFNHPDYKNIIFGSFYKTSSSNKIELKCEDDSIISTIEKNTKIENCTTNQKSKIKKQDIKIISNRVAELLR